MLYVKLANFEYFYGGYCSTIYNFDSGAFGKIVKSKFLFLVQNSATAC